MIQELNSINLAVNSADELINDTRNKIQQIQLVANETDIDLQEVGKHKLKY